MGSKGLVLKTTDGGATWTGTTNDTLGTLTSVYLRTATEGYIGSSSRKLYKTTDGGATWNRILLNAFVADTGAVVRSVYFADASKGWILTTLSSTNGRILHTTDGGTTWTQDLVVAANNMIDMYFSGPDRGVAVGKSTGTLYYTKNGTTWTAAPAPTLSGATYTRSDIRGVHMVDSLLGYAVGWGSLVGAQPSIQLRTTNGGETWAQQVQLDANKTVRQSVRRVLQECGERSVPRRCNPWQHRGPDSGQRQDVDPDRSSVRCDAEQHQRQG